MPKIHISEGVKERLSVFIEAEIKKKLKGKKGKDLTLTILEMAKKQQGITYSSMIEKLIDNYEVTR